MNKLTKILTILTGLIMVVGVFFLVRIIMVGDDVLETDAAAQASVITPIIYFSVIILLTTIAITLIFSILSLVKQPEQLKKTLLGLLVLGVVLAVSYMSASDAAVTDAFGNVVKDGEAGASNKWVGTGMIYSMILGAVGMVLFVFDLLKGLVK